VVQRPKGRPLGSKNKPISQYILEIPGGNDVVEAISKFCRCKNTDLCIQTASGTVANVMLCQPSTTTGATITFHGRFDMLSLSTTFLMASFPPIPNGFTISLAGLAGQIVRGLIAGALITVGTVYIIDASFNNPKSSLVHGTFSGSRVSYARLSIAYVAFILFF